MTQRPRWHLVCLFISSFVILSLATNKLRDPTLIDLSVVEKIKSQEREVRFWAERNLIEQRALLIRRLIALLEDKRILSENPQAIVTAIRVLGNLRAKEAAEPLVRMIDFQDPATDVPFSLPHPLKGRVAVVALIEIGRPAVTPTIEAAKKVGDDYVPGICCAAVLKGVDGEAGALFFLEMAIKSEKDAAKKLSLETVKKFILTEDLRY